MFDHQTESLWSGITGVCIDGEYTGSILETYPAVHTTWRAWKTLYPQTQVLKKPAESESSYKGYHANRQKLGIHGRRMIRSQLPPKDLVAGFQLEGVAYAVPLVDLAPGAAIFVDAGDTRVLIAMDPEASGVYVWQDTLGITSLKRSRGWPGWYKVKTKGGTQLNLTTGVLGNGVSLPRLQSTLAYWFGWHNFYPETQILHPQD